MGLLGYMAAGAVSGAGQAIQQGAQNVQAAFTQKMLMDERAKLEELRDQRQNDFQRGENVLTREHQTNLQGQHEKFLEGENFASRTHTEAMQTGRLIEEGKQKDLDRTQAKEIADATNKRIMDEAKLTRESQERIAGRQIASQETIHQQDRASHEKVAKWTNDIALQQLEDARNKVQFVTDAQGRVMKVNAQGKPLGMLMVKGEDGNETPFIAGKDLDARTKAQVEVMKTMITQYGDVAERLAQTDPAESKAYIEKAERMQNNLDVLLGGKTAPKGKSIVDPDAMPTPAVESAAPLPSASDVIVGTRAGTGLMNSLSDLKYAPPKRPAKNTVSGYRRDQ